MRALENGECLYTKKWVLPSECGQEIWVMHEVAEIACLLDIPPDRINDMLTVVSEAFLNAAEHGNAFSPGLPVRIVMRVSDSEIKFRIYDRGSGLGFGDNTVIDPQIHLQKEDPRGLGLFLISSLADLTTSGWEEGSFYMEIGFARMRTPEGDH